jgi:hypothetical protein
MASNTNQVFFELFRAAAKAKEDANEKERAAYAAIETEIERRVDERLAKSCKADDEKDFDDIIDEITCVTGVPPAYVSSVETDNGDNASTSSETRNRDLRTRLTDGQLVRHVIKKRNNSTWIGIYNRITHQIECGGANYGGRSPLNQFVVMHYNKTLGGARSANAWDVCEYMDEGTHQWKYFD